MTRRAARPLMWASALLRSAGDRLNAIDILTPHGRHVARSTAVAIPALGIAFELQLETAYSAASTVLLVAHANPGAVLAKRCRSASAAPKPPMSEHPPR
ncbi:hypothetical protein [Methylobacterium sp. ARG-1]|uniref:hypothetical protein n=1 Tax=Methylobacterium sp. ARG-1 TaxID=1692501 RepID=UPI000681D386|nr:hypothetical protein [Methylobacterium sp. ARG-1]KNY20848.1 hypothetical protein AKJ13_20560 [Methylobacterium sp. ARG-1]